MAETRMYFVVPFAEPDGRVTQAVREEVVDVARGYFLGHLISFHETFAVAMAARAELTARARRPPRPEDGS